MFERKRVPQTPEKLAKMSLGVRKPFQKLGEGAVRKTTGVA